MQQFLTVRTLRLFLERGWFMTFVVLIIHDNAIAQAIQKPSSCFNADFSNGDFTNWVGHTSVYPHATPGTNISIPYYYRTGIVNGRQTIMTTSTPDPYACKNVMTIPQGEKFAARLGNGGVGTWGDGVKWQRDYLEYTFAVTPSNALLSYKYAVILQDPNSDPSVTPHTPAIRPRFLVTIKDAATGQITDPVCGFFEVVVDETVVGFRECSSADIIAGGGELSSPGSVIYRAWSTVGVDLRNFIGKNVTIQFETWDCGLGGHFGYAYISARCDTFAIQAQTCTSNGSVLLTAPAGFSYKWIPSDETTRSIEIKDAKPGDEVEVILTTTNGCSSNLTTKIYPTITKAAFTHQGSVCLNNSIAFKDSSRSYDTKDTSDVPIITWLWDFGDGTTSTLKDPAHVYNKLGNYTVKLIAINQKGCADTARHTINVLRVPLADFSPIDACKGNSASFTDLSTTTDGNIINWSWKFGDGDTSSLQNPTHLYTATGTKTVTLSVKTDLGCMVSISKALKIWPAPKPLFSASDVCLEFQTIFQNKSTPGDALDPIQTWQWSMGDNSPMTSSKTPIHKYAKTGTYSVVLTATSQRGCSDDTSIAVNVLPPPQSDFTASDGCPGVAMVFTNNSTPAKDITNYEWNFDDKTALSNQKSPEHMYAKHGLYKVTLTVKTSFGCSDSITKTVDVSPPPDIDFDANKYEDCSPLCADFLDHSYSSYDTINKWSWDFGDGENSNTRNPSHCYVKPGVYSVSLKVTTVLGCEGSLTWPNMMRVHPFPTAAFNIATEGILTDTTVVSFYNQSIGAKEWLWNFGDKSPLSSAQHPSHVFGDTGTYSVKLIAVSEHGCKDSTINNLTILPIFRFYIPNAFTPNGNGRNDLFYGYGIGVIEYKLTIFDRWGEKIFETNDIDEGWNGELENTKVQEDVYVYMVWLRDVFKRPHRYHGIVTVIR